MKEVLQTVSDTEGLRPDLWYTSRFRSFCFIAQALQYPDESKWFS
jgi:hypothetical protein